MAVAHGIKTLGIIGSGQMGLGIAYVSALRAKVPTLLTDKSQTQLNSGFSFFNKLLEKDVNKGKISSTDAKEALDRVRLVNDARDMRDVDMVIEAVSENIALKSTIFRSLAAELRSDTILASNTSSISITKLASSVLPEGMNASSAEGQQSASRVVGLHFFNPVPVMKLVEIIAAQQTSPETLERARAFAIACGKGDSLSIRSERSSTVPYPEVTTSQDVPGFVSNALLMPFINEAIMHFEKGVATRDDIDKTLKLGMNHPMGPLQLADFIGLDTCLAIQKTLYEGTSDSKYRPSLLLQRMVDAGWLGKKSGKGFYDY
ncbi:3-hydroxyacyl-CoA dehydrogenase [Hysterangium stoloniferum]|nr:3-hydroxyacyl-CoA dehydrogenase [Hysterangium stoloniferum]